MAVVVAQTPAGAQGQEALSCSDTVIAGRVEHSEAFEAPFAAGLVLRLDPATHFQDPQGWTLRIMPAAGPDSDYSMVATPPYRFSNPRYVDTSYGIAADAALSWTPRAFAYVATDRDYEAARESIEVLLWSGGYTEAELAAARSTLNELPTYQGRLWIEDGATTPSEGDPAEPVIAWMQFRVEICLPR